MNNFKGVFTALATPYTNDDEIDQKAIKELIKLNMKNGVDGFYVCGTTAEVFLLTLEERKKVLEAVMEEVNGKCTVIAHVACINTKQAIELSKHAEKLGVDAIASVPPFYYKFSFEDIKNYYKDILDEVNVPMFVYNVPAHSGITLTLDEIKKLTDDRRVIGVKHTSMDLYQLERMKQIDKRLTILHGHEQVFLGSLIMGADGAVGSTFNFMSDKIVKIKNLFESGRIEEAKQIQYEVNEVLSLIVKVGILPGIKEALTYMGIEFGVCRKPFKRINEEEKQLVRDIVKKYCM